jgi:hypothetical protein
MLIIFASSMRYKILSFIACLHLIYAFSFCLLIVANPFGQIPPFWMLLMQAGIPTLFYTYNGQMIADKSIPDYNARLSWYQKHRNITKIYLLCILTVLIATFIYAIGLKKQGVLIARYSLYQLPALLFSYLYYPNFFVKKGLRSNGLLKPFVLGLSWACASYFPMFMLLQSQTSTVFQAILPAINLFILFSALGLLSDGRDASYDKENGVITMAVKHGWKFSNTCIALPLLCFSAGMDFLLFMQTNVLLAGVAAFLFGFISIFICIKTHPESSFLFYHFGVDGLMLVKALLWYVVMHG